MVRVRRGGGLLAGGKETGYVPTKIAGCCIQRVNLGIAVIFIFRRRNSGSRGAERHQFRCWKEHPAVERLWEWTTIYLAEKKKKGKRAFVRKMAVLGAFGRDFIPGGGMGHFRCGGTGRCWHARKEQRGGGDSTPCGPPRGIFIWDAPWGGTGKTVSD